MYVEENKALIHRFFEEIDARNVSVIDDFISREFIDHSPSPGMSADIEGQRQAFLHFLQATPDGYHAVEDILAEGDRVTVRVAPGGRRQASSSESHRPASEWRQPGSPSIGSQTARSSNTGTRWTCSGCSSNSGVIPTPEAAPAS